MENVIVHIPGERETFGFILIAICVALFAITPVLAQENDPPYCATEDPYFPNGKIARIEDRYFRICGGPISVSQSENSTESPRVLLYPRDQIVRLLADYPDRINRLNFELSTNFSANSYINRFGEILQSSDFIVFDRQRYYSVGRVSFGAGEYDIVVRGSSVMRSQDALSAGGLPPHADYLFDGPADLDLPEHYLGCKGDPLVEPHGDYNCRIVIR